MLDKFLEFTFDGVKSSEYNCFYQNTGEELLLPPYSDFTDQIAAPLYQNTTYYLGTSKTNRSFVYRCWVHDLSMNKFRELMLWLSPEKIGHLELSYIPNYHFNVKISSFSKPVLFPRENDSALGYYINAEFTITFTTIEDDAAISNYTYNFNLSNLNENTINLDFETRVPVVDFMYNFNSTSESIEKIRIFNSKPYDLYPKLHCKEVDNAKIKILDYTKYFTLDENNKKQPILWYDYNLKEGKNKPYNFTINSKYGFCLNDKTNYLIEEEFIFDWNIQNQFVNQGSFSVKPGNIKHTYMKLIDVNKVNEYEISLKFAPDNIETLEWFNEDSPIGEDENWLENEACNGVFALLKKDEDTLLYNEGGYNTGGYYINRHFSYYTYYYKRETNLLELRIKNIFNDTTEIMEDHLKWLANNINEYFKISILKYTEIIFDTSKTTETSGEQKQEKGINSIEFNLRTLF